MPSKYIFRDHATGRLIPQKVAEKRDPSTFTMEKFSPKGDGQHHGHGVVPGQCSEPESLSDDGDQRDTLLIR